MLPIVTCGEAYGEVVPLGEAALAGGGGGGRPAWGPGGGYTQRIDWLEKNISMF